MAKFTVTIPDELVPYMVETNGDPTEYIKTILLKPLFERFEFDQKKQLVNNAQEVLDQDLKRLRKGASIRV